jgi:hypothetical protein
MLLFLSKIVKMYGIVPGINACFSNMMMLLSKKKIHSELNFTTEMIYLNLSLINNYKN